jgi:hypothetical protein
MTGIPQRSKEQMLRARLRRMACLAFSGALVGLAAVAAFAQPVSDASTPAFKWRTVVNNGDAMPGSDATFNSYNQPSVNAYGFVVFRARSKGPSQPVRGIYSRNLANPSSKIKKIVAVGDTVPQPNNTDAAFNEFPAFPRINIWDRNYAFRGVHEPVYEYTVNDVSTKIGTAGVYKNNPSGKLVAGASQLGTISGFEYFLVPGTPVDTKFDQFPGAPSATVNFIVFKGNYSEDGVSKTGVYFRRTLKAKAPVHLIANTGMPIPNDSDFTFGSTAPPSAASGNMVFVGLDNEDNPEHGGIYLAPMAAGAKLTTLVPFGAPVPGVTDATLAQFGEGLSYDGRYVAFWGAWGDETKTITLTCPTDGNAALIAYCLQQYPPDGVTTVQERVNQGIFVYDTVRHKNWMVAQTGLDSYDDFVYWTYSGRPPQSGGGEDFEPPRWRSSAFVAVTGNGGSFKVAYKATKDDGTQGIYMASGPPVSLDKHLTVVDTNTAGDTIDPKAPAGVYVTSVGIERDGFRGDGVSKPRLAIAIGMADATDTVTWGGIYVARPPTP